MIYNAIKKGLLLEDAIKLFPRKGKQRPKGSVEKKGGRIPFKKMIEERPEPASIRSEIGHYESDTMVGTDKKRAIMTYVCRQSRYLFAKLLPNRRADPLNQVTVDIFIII